METNTANRQIESAVVYFDDDTWTWLLQVCYTDGHEECQPVDHPETLAALVCGDMPGRDDSAALKAELVAWAPLKAWSMRLGQPGQETIGDLYPEDRGDKPRMICKVTFETPLSHEQRDHYMERDADVERFITFSEQCGNTNHKVAVVPREYAGNSHIAS